MRLKNALSEAIFKENDQEFNDLIKKECKPYLNLIKSSGPMVRGLDIKKGDTLFKKGASFGLMDDSMFVVKSVRKDRKPRGMHISIANILNKWLQENGHVRRDKSVMCTSSTALASMFNIPFFIFPIGTFKYTYIEVFDINITRDNWPRNSIDNWASIETDKHLPSYEEEMKEFNDTLKKPFPKYFHTNEGYNEAYKNEYEMWIECDKYYAADAWATRWTNGKILKKF